LEVHLLSYSYHPYQSQRKIAENPNSPIELNSWRRKEREQDLIIDELCNETTWEEGERRNERLC